TLDADLLDGLNSDQFLRSDTSDSFTSGVLSIATGTTFQVDSGSTLDINSINVSIADTDILFDGATTTFTTNGALTLDSGSNTLTLATNDTTISALGLTTFTANATLGVSSTQFNLGAGASATIGTETNGNLSLSPNGTGNIILGSDFNTSTLIGTATTPAPLSISGGIGGNAALIVNQSNSGDILAASASGTTRFAIANNGNISFYGNQSVPITLTSAAVTPKTITFPDETGTICIQGSLSCGFAIGTVYWDQVNGALSAKNTTVDLLIGGTSTASAKFAVTNINSGTPTASISANTGDNATFITGSGNLGTTNAQTLTLGGSTTGNIVIDSGSSAITLADNTTVTGTLGVTGQVTSNDSFRILENGGTPTDYGTLDVAALTGDQTYTFSG
ncbi:MAG: hypothetical protein Q7T74_02450, partial [Candidatus Saccharibacteria bacterium]|nr:hypothetical protein [Candidatus Saccharibacteria bacterium]